MILDKYFLDSILSKTNIYVFSNYFKVFIKFTLNCERLYQNMYNIKCVGLNLDLIYFMNQSLQITVETTCHNLTKDNIETHSIIDLTLTHLRKYE